MLKLLMSTAIVAGSLMAVAGAADAAGKKYTFALVPKNTNNPFFDQALAGCKQGREGTRGLRRVPLYRPRRARRR